MRIATGRGAQADANPRRFLHVPSGAAIVPRVNSGPIIMWLEKLLSEGADALRLRNDLEYFAETALKLRPKAGPLEPFKFNAAQKKLHALLEEQKAKTGKVRAVILKARQLGISSYTAARFYHRTIHSPGLRTIILGHERRASSNLFQIVKRFHDNLGDELRPSVGTSNAEELIF